MNPGHAEREPRPAARPAGRRWLGGAGRRPRPRADRLGGRRGGRRLGPEHVAGDGIGRGDHCLFATTCSEYWPLQRGTRSPGSAASSATSARPPTRTAVSSVYLRLPAAEGGVRPHRGAGRQGRGQRGTRCPGREGAACPRAPGRRARPGRGRDHRAGDQPCRPRAGTAVRGRRRLARGRQPVRRSPASRHPVGGGKHGRHPRIPAGRGRGEHPWHGPARMRCGRPGPGPKPPVRQADRI